MNSARKEANNHTGKRFDPVTELWCVVLAREGRWRPGVGGGGRGSALCGPMLGCHWGLAGLFDRAPLKGIDRGQGVCSR